MVALRCRAQRRTLPAILRGREFPLNTRLSARCGIAGAAACLSVRSTASVNRHHPATGAAERPQGGTWSTRRAFAVPWISSRRSLSCANETGGNSHRLLRLGWPRSRAWRRHSRPATYTRVANATIRTVTSLLAAGTIDRRDAATRGLVTGRPCAIRGWRPQTSFIARGPDLPLAMVSAQAVTSAGLRQ